MQDWTGSSVFFFLMNISTARDETASDNKSCLVNLHTLYQYVQKQRRKLENPMSISSAAARLFTVSVNE